MSPTRRPLLTTALFCFAIPAWGQAGNSCDLNQDGKVDVTDVQAAINMSLGVSSCTANIAGTNACNVVVVQRVVNAALGGACTTSTGLHVISLNWTASTSANITGYKIYRSSTSGGSYTLLQSVGAVTSFTDNTVASGRTYYYVITAVNSSNTESSYSKETPATVPTP